MDTQAVNIADGMDPMHKLVQELRGITDAVNNSVELLNRMNQRIEQANTILGDIQNDNLTIRRDMLEVIQAVRGSGNTFCVAVQNPPVQASSPPAVAVVEN